MNCTTKNPVVVEANPIVESSPVETVIQEGLPEVGTTRVISRKIIDVTPVTTYNGHHYQYIPKSMNTFSIGSITVTGIHTTLNVGTVMQLDNRRNGLLLMMKILIGIILGIVLVTYYPEIGSVVSEIFIETGMRDNLVKL